MTQHDQWVRVRHMRDHAREAIDLLGGKTLEDLHQDRVLQLALVQLIEIVGEAASRVESEVAAANPQIPWKLAAGMRHRLIHGYDLIEYAIVHDTVRHDLPNLVAQLDVILPPLRPNEAE